MLGDLTRHDYKLLEIGMFVSYESSSDSSSDKDLFSLLFSKKFKTINGV